MTKTATPLAQSNLKGWPPLSFRHTSSQSQPAPGPLDLYPYLLEFGSVSLTVTCSNDHACCSDYRREPRVSCGL